MLLQNTYKLNPFNFYFGEMKKVYVKFKLVNFIMKIRKRLDKIVSECSFIDEF